MQASNPLQNTLAEQDYLEGEKISNVRLSCIDAELPLAQIYKRVDF